jgi:hypothetical protein
LNELHDQSYFHIRNHSADKLTNLGLQLNSFTWWFCIPNKINVHFDRNRNGLPYFHFCWHVVDVGYCLPTLYFVFLFNECLFRKINTSLKINNWFWFLWQTIKDPLQYIISFSAIYSIDLVTLTILKMDGQNWTVHLLQWIIHGRESGSMTKHDWRFQYILIIKLKVINNLNKTQLSHGN